MKVLLTWDDKSVRSPYATQIEEHLQGEHYRLVKGTGSQRRRRGHRVARGPGPAAATDRQDRADRGPVEGAGLGPAAGPRPGPGNGRPGVRDRRRRRGDQRLPGDDRPAGTVRRGRLGAHHLADPGRDRRRRDATVTPAHSEKELAEPNFKGFGHHPLLSYCDNTDEPLAGMMRKGSAGSNTTADHIEVT